MSAKAEGRNTQLKHVSSKLTYTTHLCEQKRAPIQFTSTHETRKPTL